jgi:hypothetical protein
MITTEEFLNAVSYRISGGSEFQWGCFGHNARYLDSEFRDRYSASIVFDTETQVVYEATVCDQVTNRAYRWTNPEFRAAYEAESRSRTVDQGWGDVSYTNLEVPEDWLSKARAIVNGESYDARVEVPIDLPDHELLRLMTMAHEQDITLNQLVEQILTVAIQSQREQTETCGQ